VRPDHRKCATGDEGSRTSARDREMQEGTVEAIVCKLRALERMVFELQQGLYILLSIVLL
jgi:hypothetical protein